MVVWLTRANRFLHRLLISNLSALVCGAETQGLKITEDEGVTLTMISNERLDASSGSDDHVDITVPSPVGDAKTVSSISTVVLNTLTLK